MPPTDGQVLPAKSDGDSNAVMTANSAMSVPYTCTFCQRSFPRLSLLKKHEQAHSNEMPFRCDYCMRLFKHKRSRDRHVKLHTGDKKYRCEHCEAAFSRSDHLKIHIKTHDTRKPFQCNVCQRGYSTAAALTSHMLNHQRESGSRCGSLCSSISSPVSVASCVTTSSNASTPCPSITPSLPSPTSIPSSPVHAATPSPPSKETSVTTCKASQTHRADDGADFRTPKHLDSVEQSAVKTNGDEKCCSPSANDAKSRPAMIENSIVLNCPYCASSSTETFSSLEALSTHVQSLHGPSLPRSSYQGIAQVAPISGSIFACQLCGVHLASVQSLQQHTLSAHSLTDVLQLYCQAQATPTPCEPPQNQPTDLSCRSSKSLVTSQQVEILQQDKTAEASATPLVANLHYCPHCEFSAGERDRFESHLATHLLVTSSEYICQSCCKTFAKPDELQKHLLDIHAHHLYRCSLCEEMFDSKVAIQVHFAVKHSNECTLYRCTACSFFSTSQQDFANHAKCHMTARLVQAAAPLACPICPDSFSGQFLLERHVQLAHPTGPVVTCDLCHERFADSALLQVHAKQRHHHPAPAEQAAANHNNHDKTVAPVLNLSLHCAYCGETCKSRIDLESHMKSHHHPPTGTLFGGRFKCNICDQMFGSTSVLAEHKLTHCKVVGATQCTSCHGIIKSEQDFYSHLQTHGHQTPPFACIVCRQTLNLTLEVGLHAKYHTKSSEPLYPCCLCRKQFESENLIANGMAPGGLQTYVCKECLQARNHLILQSAFCLQQQQQQPSVQPRSYQCIKCQQIFPTEAEIQAHVATHLLTEGCDHDCRLCRTKFDTPLKLQTHLIEHTFSGCAGFTCYLCGSMFTAAANLQKHMFEHGLAAKPYDCSHCHLKFFFRAELDNHLFIHENDQTPTTPTQETSDAATDEEDNKTAEDAMSNWSESTEITLSDAKKAANAVPDDLPEEATNDNDSMAGQQYRCDRCDKSFPCLSNLQGHVRIHTQSTRFTCPTCHKEFALSRNLHIHMRSHSGEKPYECPVCHKRFARKENRKAHVKLHSAVKPFSCHVCAKSFSRKCHLREHSRTHSNSKIIRSEPNNVPDSNREAPQINLPEKSSQT